MATPTGKPETAAFNAFTRCVFTIGLPVSFAGLIYMSPPTAALTPILLAPVVLAAYKRSRLPPAEAGDFNRAVRVWSFNAAFGPLIAGGVQASVTFLLMKLLFGDQARAYLRELLRSSIAGSSPELLTTRATMARDPRYIFVLAVFSYLLAGVVEEGMKYLSLRLALIKSPAKHELDHLTYAIAAGLGFATLENVGLTYTTIKNQETMSKVALTVFERTVFGVLGHCATATLTATRSVRRDARGEKMSAWQVFSKSALYHGTFDLMLFSICAFEGNPGWIRPTNLWSNVVMYALGLGLHGSLYAECWREVKSLRLHAC